MSRSIFVNRLVRFVARRPCGTAVIFVIMAVLAIVAVDAILLHPPPSGGASFGARGLGTMFRDDRGHYYLDPSEFARAMGTHAGHNVFPIGVYEYTADWNEFGEWSPWLRKSTITFAKVAGELDLKPHAEAQDQVWRDALAEAFKTDKNFAVWAPMVRAGHSTSRKLLFGGVWHYARASFLRQWLPISLLTLAGVGGLFWLANAYRRSAIATGRCCSCCGYSLEGVVSGICPECGPGAIAQSRP